MQNRNEPKLSQVHIITSILNRNALLFVDFIFTYLSVFNLKCFNLIYLNCINKKVQKIPIFSKKLMIHDLQFLIRLSFSYSDEQVLKQA